MPSVLIGLSNAPDLIELNDSDKFYTLHPDQLESIVVPNGALGGEAVLACVEKGLNIISVKNKNILNVTNNSLNYPNLIEVNNYVESCRYNSCYKKGN